MEQRPELFSNFGWPEYVFYLQKLPDPSAESIGCPQNKPENKGTKLGNGWCQNNGDKYGQNNRIFGIFFLVDFLFSSLTTPNVFIVMVLKCTY